MQTREREEGREKRRERGAGLVSAAHHKDVQAGTAVSHSTVVLKEEASSAPGKKSRQRGLLAILTQPVEEKKEAVHTSGHFFHSL